ncbi:C4-dicarboxylate transporter/malic acid transport protein [Lentzea atacamensis]|uniref:C4-dicarboxylate transporter/malic acid transport protein n=1 Tax=Lentzea atacamensis TaxID=531938 RepID=A0ABX9EJP6_9PSEU|nr:C4-dicarboxylate transporter/malic acid transport protein [Lentzea atacamensis]
MTALAPHPHRAPEVRRAAPFGPNLFASVMGTGIVATAGAAMPGLRTPVTVVWALDAALLAFLVVAALRRWTWATVRDQLADPVMAQFWGAPPMALMTVGTGTLLLGSDWIGLTAALAIDWTLWTLGTALGLMTSVLVPLRMIGSGERAFGGWLMPVVPPMVSAASGALLAQHLPEGQFRQAMVLGCYALFGVSLFATLMIVPQIWQRLVQHGLGAASTVPTLWIVLGPLGQSITAANLLAGVHVLPGQTAFGVLYGTTTWGFALLWVAIAATATVRTARRGLPFALTWWSFVFPLGTLVTGTSALAKHVPSPMFTCVSIVLYGTLVLAWITVAVRTLAQRSA